MRMVVVAGLMRFLGRTRNTTGKHRQDCEKMDELLLRYLRGRTTEDENRSVGAWLGRTADAEGALADLSRLVRAGEAADLAIDPGDPPAAEQLIWRAEARRTQLGSPPRHARPRLRRYGAWITAAAAVTIGFTLWNVSRPTDPTRDKRRRRPGFPHDHRRNRHGPARRRQCHPAGTREPADHAPDPLAGAARAAGDPRRRGVLLHRGGPTPRPFVVTTAAGSARVLGTRFHLAAQADRLAIVVVEGRVALAGRDQEVEVGAGQATRLVGGSAEPVEDAPPIEQVADWLGDFLIFQDTPLAVAMREVGLRYGREVEISDPILTERTLTMWFNGKSLEEVMTVVCSVIDAHCTIGETKVRIEARARPERSREGPGSVSGSARGNRPRPHHPPHHGPPRRATTTRGRPAPRPDRHRTRTRLPPRHPPPASPSSSCPWPTLSPGSPSDRASRSPSAPPFYPPATSSPAPAPH